MMRISRGLSSSYGGECLCLCGRVYVSIWEVDRGEKAEKEYEPCEEVLVGFYAKNRGR
jgi:hypothetical protein